MWSGVLLLLLVGAGRGVGRAPNLLLLVADDMGWGDLGANVPDLPSNTPFLDSLAKNGLRLVDFHAGASVCSPSRAALLTGRLGLRTGVVTNFAPDSEGGLPAAETTLAEVLQRAGYRTAMLGKWHLGTRPGFHPLDRGFERYLGVPYSLDMGCASPPGLDLPPVDSCPRGRAAGVSQAARWPLALPLYHDREIAHQPVALRSLAKHYAEFGERFIKENSSAPFFLYAAFSHVHVPLAHGARFRNATGRGLFANTLAEMDWLAKRLSRAAEATGGSTLTWFLSDNGPWEAKCSLAGRGGPFRGAWQRDLTAGGGGSASKQTVWEAGHRVPAFLHWPGHVEGGVSDALLSALDVFPTAAALAGAALPANRTLDGVSLADDLAKGRNLIGHQELFHPNSGAAGPAGAVGAVRVGRYKTVLFAGGAAGCSQPAGPARELNPPLAFDLRRDSAEATPLSQPDLADAVVRRASQSLSRLLASVRADQTSVANYDTNPSSRPCCSVERVACVCPWD